MYNCKTLKSIKGENMSEFYNLSTFASKLSVTPETASKKIREGEYIAYKRGKSYKIPSCAIDLKEIKEYEEIKQKQTATKVAKTFMIGNQKGGSGKTTSSINIAASLAFFGYKVLLIDNDCQSNASTINMLHMKHNFDKHNITRILLEMKDLNKEALQKRVSKAIVSVDSEHFTNGKLDLFPNSIEYDEKKELLFTYPNAENMLNRLLRPLREEYDYIIIDTHPSMDIMWRMSVMASDAIVIGLMAEKYSIDGLGGVFKRVYSLNEDYKEIKGHDIEVLGAIVANFKKNTTIAQINAPVLQESLNKYCLYNDSLVLKPFISHTVKVAEQQSLRGPIMFDEPSNKMNAEYLELSTNILFQLHLLDEQRG